MDGRTYPKKTIHHDATEREKYTEAVWYSSGDVLAHEAVTEGTMLLKPNPSTYIE